MKKKKTQESGSVCLKNVSRPIFKVTMSECCWQHFNLIKLIIVIIKIIFVYTILSYLQYVFERFPNKLKTPLTIIYQVVLFLNLSFMEILSEHITFIFMTEGYNFKKFDNLFLFLLN